MFDIFKKLSSISTTQKPVDFIIVGLGNPGKKYEQTRHNLGFMVIDYIASQHACSVDKLKFKSLYCPIVLNGKKGILLKPQTFMNLSGQAVCEAMSFYKIPAEKTILIFDDISLNPGKIRIKKKGSSGGHNGVKDIITLSGTNLFPRIKLGVGSKPIGWDLSDWVTSNVGDNDKTDIETAIKNAAEAVNLMICNNIEQAMSLFNS